MKFLITEPEFYNHDKYSMNHIFKKYSFDNQNEFDNHLKNNFYDGIFAKLGLVLKESNLLSQSSLKFIASPTTGINHIEEDYCIKKSIKILSLKNENRYLKSITTTAEHAWMLMLMCGRSSKQMLENTKNYKWERNGLDIMQFKNKVVGIIGIGRLGKMIEEYCYSFGMKVIYNDINKQKSSKYITSKRSSLEDLLKKSDVIFISASYAENRSKLIIGSEEIKIIKKGSILINISRGELIDNESLLNSLKKGLLKAIGLDVLPKDSEWEGNSQESLKNNKLYKSLVKEPNVYLTPHVGGYAKEAIYSTRDFILEKAMKFAGIIQ